MIQWQSIIILCKKNKFSHFFQYKMMMMMLKLRRMSRFLIFQDLGLPTDVK